MAHTPPGTTRERVWRFVRAQLLAGEPPTVREVQHAFGFRAVESARAHLEALVEAGFLEKEAPADGGGGRARGYRLPAASRGATSAALVPVLGRVQAGALTTAVEEIEGLVAVQMRTPSAAAAATASMTAATTAASAPPGGNLFALRVRGDSMRGAGILEGDLVIVRRQETADDGQIVVALVGDEATVKRLRIVHGVGRAAGRVELHPESPGFEVIVPPPGEVRILGRVIEVRRHLDPATSAPWDAAAAAALPVFGSAERVPPATRRRRRAAPVRATAAPAAAPVRTTAAPGAAPERR